MVAEPTAPQPDTLTMLGLLVGIPLLAIAIIAAIILGPQWSRAGRWRPGQPWREEPVWVGAGSAQVVAATLGQQESQESAAQVTDALATQRINEGLGGARGQW